MLIIVITSIVIVVLLISIVCPIDAFCSSACPSFHHRWSLSMMYHLFFYLVASSSAVASSSSACCKKRKAASLAQLMPEGDVRALLRCGTKTRMCMALETLQRSGLLCTNDSNRKLRRTLQNASVQHGSTVTAYGTIIQKVDLGIPGVGPWEY